MKKRLISTLLALCMTLALLPNTVFAANDIITSGECGAQGDNLTWTLDSEGILTISGEGEMADYSGNTNYIPWPCNEVKLIEIADTVTSIGGHAFWGCKSLTIVNIPSSVTRIGRQAFYGCSALNSIIIPESVSDFEDNPTTWGTFEGCTSLSSAGPVGGNYNIQFGWTEKIPSCVFSGCTALTSVVIPDGITGIDDYAFYRCAGLTEVTIPNGVTIIGLGVFNGCQSLSSVIIPDSVTSIPYGADSIYAAPFGNCPLLTSAGPIGGDYNIQFGWTEKIPSCAFCKCTSLTNVVIPEGITSIGQMAFYFCPLLDRVVIPSSAVEFASDAFWCCTKLTSAGPIGGDYNMQFSWTSEIPGNAFSNCSLNSVMIPKGITGIGDNAFFACHSLAEVVIPDGVTSIGAYAFESCSAITSITIPNSVAKIGSNAFFTMSPFLTR